MKKIIFLKISYKSFFSIIENGFVRTLAIVCFMFFATYSLTSAQWLPVILTETGDTLDYEYTFPPPDSTFVPGEIIIRFRKNALNMYMLCFPLQGPYDVKKKKSNDEFHDYPYESRESIMNQRFYVDDIIVDNDLLAAVKSFGGDTLRRITYADPCRDTISITRLGDTLKCEDYLWMTLQMNNDTNEVAASVYLSQFMQHAIIMAQLNFYYKPDATPSDEFYDTKQFSLHDEMIGMETAWNYTTGDYDIIVGVIDNGVNYEHCEFGNQTEMGLGDKVSWGKYYYEQNDSVHTYSWHGTPVAGIIGALTNQTNPECDSLGRGIAGIAGGWGNEKGCQLHAYRVDKPVEFGGIKWATEYIVAAIREAAADRQDGSGYGQANHVLNFSASEDSTKQPDNAMIAAVNWAYEHGVTFVNSRGNPGDDGYPGAFFTQKAINVGGGDTNKNLMFLYPSGNNMDLLAPAEDDQVYAPQEINYNWRKFGMTSGAAPHVSGVVALLRSFAINQEENYPDIVWQNLEPEDYEGMILASAEDRVFDDNPLYTDGYDEYTGWGHLQADNLFNMIGDGYRITHFTVDANSYPNNPAIFDVEIGEWSEPYQVYFQNNSIGNKGFQPGYLRVRRREWSATIYLNQVAIFKTWENGLGVIPFYVWGRKGNAEIGGYSAENLPNFQTRWTKVTSGTGVPESQSQIPAIIHTNNLYVEVQTFQYARLDKDDIIIERIPLDEQIGYNISTFSKEPIPLSVDESKQNKISKKIDLYPNAADNILNVRINNQTLPVNHIQILDINGNIVLEKMDNLSFNNRIDISGLSSGMYLCRVKIGNNYVAHRFTVVK